MSRGVYLRVSSFFYCLLLKKMKLFYRFVNRCIIDKKSKALEFICIVFFCCLGFFCLILVMKIGRDVVKTWVLFYSILFVFFNLSVRGFSWYRIGLVSFLLFFTFFFPFLDISILVDFSLFWRTFLGKIALCSDLPSRSTDQYLDQGVKKHFKKYNQEPVVLNRQAFDKVIKKMAFPKNHLEPIQEEGENLRTLTGSKLPRIPEEENIEK